MCKIMLRMRSPDGYEEKIIENDIKSSSHLVILQKFLSLNRKVERSWGHHPRPSVHVIVRTDIVSCFFRWIWIYYVFWRRILLRGTFRFIARSRWKSGIRLVYPARRSVLKPTDDHIIAVLTERSLWHPWHVVGGRMTASSWLGTLLLKSTTEMTNSWSEVRRRPVEILRKTSKWRR